MRVYVAGSSRRPERARKVIKDIEGAGHEITFDWTGPEGELRPDLDPNDLAVESTTKGHGILHERDVDHVVLIEHKPTGKTGRGVAGSQLQARERALSALRRDLKIGWRNNPEKARELAQREQKACWDADVGVLVLAPDMLGASIEIGMILGDEKPVLVLIDEYDRDSVFWYLPGCRIVDSVEEVLKELGREDELLMEASVGNKPQGDFDWPDDYAP